MKNTKKNHQIQKVEASSVMVFRALPIIAAMAASGIIQPAFAIDHTWFGGTGDWGVNTNWSPASVPGASDKAIINGGNSTLSFNTSITALDLSGGTLGGTGNLTLSGSSAWTGGAISGAATTTFSSTLAMSGDAGRTISGGRIVDAGNTTWSGNTFANANDIFFNGGTFNNTGTFTDTNAFSDQMTGSGTFNNSGTYNKQNNTLTTVGIVFNNTGTVDVNAGTLRLNTNGTHSGSFAMASGTTLDFNFGTHNLNAVTTSGAGTFQVSGGTVNLNGGSHTTHFLLSGGTLAGTSTPIGGAADWTGGAIFGAATTTFNSTLAMSGDAAEPSRADA